MTEKNFEYYKQKTKVDDARRASRAKKDSKAETAIGAAYFFSIGLRRFVNSILRAVAILGALVNVVIGVVVYINNEKMEANTPLVFLFIAINVILIIVASMIFWRRVIYVVIASLAVLSIFAAAVPFYTGDPCDYSKFSDENLASRCKLENRNYYGKTIGSAE